LSSQDVAILNGEIRAYKDGSAMAKVYNRRSMRDKKQKQPEDYQRTLTLLMQPTKS
jgi:hypothetical protein